MCCELCCKEFKGWCQSFTRTERALTALEAVLLVVLVTFLIFLILHLLACSTPEPKHEESGQPEQYQEVEYEETESTTVPTQHGTTKINLLPETTRSGKRTTVTTRIPHQTIEPEVECSWTPSAKTTAFTHYYEKSDSHSSNVYNDITQSPAHSKPAKVSRKTTTKPHDPRLDKNIDLIQIDQSDGEDAEPMQKQFILSLVKLKPPQSVAFGCILTIIGDYWMLTSASCIEAIEEVDSLDSFVIMEDYGTSFNGKIHSIHDLQIHPFYQGFNRSYDLAIIQSESRLLNGRAVELPTLLDTSMITIGERFHVLGFGAYRSIDRGPRGRRLRKVYLYRVPGAQCAGAGWAARHLEAGRGVPRAAPGGAGGALCAGALYARGLPCNYCGGAPLLRGPRLLAVMADNAQCGVACEPQLYANVAAVRDWIDAVVKAQ